MGPLVVVSPASHTEDFLAEEDPAEAPSVAMDRLEAFLQVFTVAQLEDFLAEEDPAVALTPAEAPSVVMGRLEASHPVVTVAQLEDSPAAVMEASGL